MHNGVSSLRKHENTWPVLHLSYRPHPYKYSSESSLYSYTQQKTKDHKKYRLLFFRLTLFHDLNITPVLLLAQRPGLHKLDPISHLAHAAFIVSFESCHSPQNFFIDRMNDRPRNHDDDGLLHLVTDDVAIPMTTLYHLSHSVLYLLVPSTRAFTCWRTVFTRAISRFVFRICMGFSRRPEPN